MFFKRYITLKKKNTFLVLSRVLRRANLTKNGSWVHAILCQLLF